MSNGSEHTPERCVHAVDGPDWAGLRELPTSWKERAIAAETKRDALQAQLDKVRGALNEYREHTLPGVWLAMRLADVAEWTVVPEGDTNA